jgi:hypothetical protein
MSVAVAGLPPVLLSRFQAKPEPPSGYPWWDGRMSMLAFIGEMEATLFLPWLAADTAVAATITLAPLTAFVFELAGAPEFPAIRA